MEAPGAAATTAAWAPGPGSKLGKFTLLEPIGEGGMARLYLARTEGLGGFEKRVVVKQILPHLAEDGEFIARFIQEARLSATLDHPNIAAVYEVDVHHGIYFYSMEYVRGRDLRRVLRRAERRARVLSEGEIVAIVGGLCAGLHHAHTKRDEQGEPLAIVHRDVSPANVLIGFEGAVKLTDFGIAKARTGVVSTEAGMLRGKIAYMSPEQCRGEALDRRSDVHAVGALMWELITGRRLHQAESDMMLLRRIAETDAPSPRTLRPDCPEALERIVARALHRDPSQRYQSAAALLDDLERHGQRAGLATSASAVARLMEELFGGEVTPFTPLEVGRGTPVALADETPPTGTVAPVLDPPGSPRGAPGQTGLEEAPTRRVRPAVPHGNDARGDGRSWGPLAMGLALGVLLGGGGLYLASRSDEASEASAAPEGAEQASPGVVAPAGIAASDVDEAAAPQAETTPSPAPEANDGGGAEAEDAEAEDAEAEDAEASPPETRPRRKKSRRRPRSTPRRDASINLDSPMPPGLAAR